VSCEFPHVSVPWKVTSAVPLLGAAKEKLRTTRGVGSSYSKKMQYPLAVTHGACVLMRGAAAAASGRNSQPSKTRIENAFGDSVMAAS
jgi:hypothetical protein